MIDRFWQFVNERESIRIRKESGAAAPLTDDPRLRDYWFPNIRRTDDPTTLWIWVQARRIKSKQHQLMAIATFRQFCRIETGELLLPMFQHHGYDTHLMLDALKGTSGRYNTRLPLGLLHNDLGRTAEVLGRIDWETLGVRLCDANLYEAHTCLVSAGIGPELAWEIVCDLARTSWLETATDRFTWAFPSRPSCLGAGILLKRDLSASRAADRELTVELYQKLCQKAPGWEPAEAQRALSLFYTWARRDKPTRRYRWN